MTYLINYYWLVLFVSSKVFGLFCNSSLKINVKLLFKFPFINRQTNIMTYLINNYFSSIIMFSSIIHQQLFINNYSSTIIHQLFIISSTVMFSSIIMFSSTIIHQQFSSIIHHFINYYVFNNNCFQVFPRGAGHAGEQCHRVAGAGGGLCGGGPAPQ